MERDSFTLEIPSPTSVMDSKTVQLDDILFVFLVNAYHKQTSKVILHDIVKIACEHAPIDFVYAASRLPPNIRPILYENLADLEGLIAFMIKTDMGTRTAVFRHINDKEAKLLVEQMPPDDAVSVMEVLPEKRFRRIMEMIEVQKAARIREIKQHEWNTAGRLMTNEFFAFSMDVTIGEAAAVIRDNPGIELTRQIFVLNLAGELQGYVPERNLIVNPPHIPLRQVMKSVLHKVSPEASREEVVDVAERYKLPALPVVNTEEQLLGVVTKKNKKETKKDIAD